MFNFPFPIFKFQICLLWSLTTEMYIVHLYLQHSKNSLVIWAPFQLRFIRASGTNTVTPPRRCMVTVCSVVGTLYTDFKNGTVLFTIELHTTDRLSPSLHRLSSASSVKEPLVSTARRLPKRRAFGT